MAEKEKILCEIIKYGNAALEYYNGFPEHTGNYIADLEIIIQEANQGLSNIKTDKSLSAITPLTSLGDDVCEMDHEVVVSKTNWHKKKHHHTVRKDLMHVESKECLGGTQQKGHKGGIVEEARSESHLIVSQDDVSLWSYVQKSMDKLLKKYMPHLPDQHFWMKSELSASGFLKTSKKKVLSSDRNHHDYFNPLVISTVRKLEQYEKSGDLEKSINIIL